MIFNSILLFVTIVLPLLASAGLGDKVPRPSTARSSVSAAKAMTTAGYRVQETVASGIQIKEYINDSDVVFAVTWRGVVKPDLEDLLGSTYKAFKSNDAKTNSQVQGRLKTVQTDKAVVQLHGHPRDLRGLAYLKDLLPIGFNLEDLQ